MLPGLGDAVPRQLAQKARKGAGKKTMYIYIYIYIYVNPVIIHMICLCTSVTTK